MRWPALLLACAGCDAVFALDPPPGAPDAWLAGSHAFRKQLVITPPTRQPLIDFPVGVVLASDADLADAAQPDAGDLVFTADDGTTTLDHELERYVASTGELVAWVRVPELAGTTTLYVYYGGPPVPATDTPWTDAYGAVWHLGGASVASEPDSTRHGNTLSAGTADAPGSVAGVAGLARSFDGDGDELTATDHATLDVTDPGGSLTYSLWVNAGMPLGDYDSPLGKGGNRAENAGYVIQLGRGMWTTSIADGDEDQRIVRLGDDGALAGWAHLAVVVDRTHAELRAYVNGESIGHTTLDSFGSFASDFDLALSPEVDPFRGVVDEVRIVHAALSAVWLQTEHANLVDLDFLRVGGEELRPR